MLPPLSSFVAKTFKVYLSLLKNLLPYLALIFVLILFVFFARNSTALFFQLVPGTYTKFVIHLFVVACFAFVSFALTISIIRLIGSRYFSEKKPKFFDNIKESFSLAWKNIFALVFLGLPKILTYLIYFLVFNFHIPIQLLALLYYVIMFVGLFYFFWMSFVVVSIALEKQKLFSAIKASMDVVRGRVWQVFVRLFLPAIIMYISFEIYDYLNDTLLGIHVWSILVVFVLALLLIPFGLAIPTILYLELKKNPTSIEKNT